MALLGADLLAGLFSRLSQVEALMEEEQVLELTGDDILADVRAKFGHQQEGWPDLADTTQADRARQGYPADEPLLREGALRDAYEVWRDGPDVVVGVRPESDQAVIAEAQEFGTATIPPRPVLGPTVAEDAHKLPERVWETLDHIGKPR